MIELERARPFLKVRHDGILATITVPVIDRLEDAAPRADAFSVARRWI